jgi:excisionase family DNA binding protein
VEAWSVQRVAEILHVSESTVRRLILAGAFPGAFRVGRKLVRIPITDLDAYQRRARLLQRTEGRTTSDADLPLPFEGHA